MGVRGGYPRLFVWEAMAIFWERRVLSIPVMDTDPRATVLECSKDSIIKPGKGGGSACMHTAPDSEPSGPGQMEPAIVR